MEVEILLIEYGSKEYFDTVSLRNEVFRKPYGLDIKDDDLSEDRRMHMYGVYIDNRLIGTVFLDEKDKNTAQIKAVALLDEFRGIGLGDYLMQFIENVAKEKGYRKTFLTGRVYALNFYERLGYQAVGQPYDYKTIPHIAMEKTL